MNLSQSMGNSNFKRYPAKRVLLIDLTNGQWNEEEKILATRYGSIKRVRICGTIINKKEVAEEKSEDSFLADSPQSNSRISIQIDDCTGRIWGTLFKVVLEEYDYFKKGDLVDVVGIVKTYQNYVNVIIEFVRKVNNPNYETYHILEVLSNRKFEKRYEIEKINPQKFDDFDFETSNSSQFSDNTQKVVEHTEESAEISTFEQNSDSASDSDTKSDFDSISKDFENMDIYEKIVAFISKIDGGDGVPVENISQKFSIDINELKPILNRLSQDIKIYKAQPGHYSSY